MPSDTGIVESLRHNKVFQGLTVIPAWFMISFVVVN